jgi:hypothetical protein
LSCVAGPYWSLQGTCHATQDLPSRIVSIRVSRLLRFWFGKWAGPIVMIYFIRDEAAKSIKIGDADEAQIETQHPVVLAAISHQRTGAMVPQLA